MHALERRLKAILEKGRVTIVCIGNSMRGDDGVGPFIASLLKGNSRHEVIDAGVAPENYSAVVRRSAPAVIILIDSVRFSAIPGEAGLFRREDLRSGKVSTHDLSPGLFIEYLSESTGAEVYILGVNPSCNEPGKGLSKEVRHTATYIANLLM